MKYLAVDLGNVICRVDFSNFGKKLSRTLNLSSDEVNYFLNRNQKLHDLGITNMADELTDHFKIKSPEIISDLLEEWGKTVVTDPFMLTALTNLMYDNNEPIMVALLSNIGQDHAALIRDILTPTVFDNAIHFLSCDVGARKPTHLYYKTFLDMYPKFKGCVYIDDRIENIEAGALFGFNAQHFELDKFKSVPELAEIFAQIKSLI